jgi:hypothetical protein
VEDFTNAIFDVEQRLNNLDSELEELNSNLQSIMRINTSNLEKDCADHVYYYSMAAQFDSSVKLVLAKAQLLVKELKAFTGVDVRANPDNYGIVKITESVVFELVDSSTIVADARHLRVRAEGLAAKSMSIMQSFEHRRSMLNNEVQLLLAGHISESKEAEIKDYSTQIKQHKKTDPKPAARRPAVARRTE